MTLTVKHIEDFIELCASQGLINETTRVTDMENNDLILCLSEDGTIRISPVG